MIQSKELRRGNYIQDKEGVCLQVSGITIDERIAYKFKEDDDHPYFLFELEYADGILITHEVLVKAGFDFVHDYYSKGNYELFYANGYWWIAGVNEGDKGLEFVHQLQNLFYFLSGEELIINL